MAASASFLVIDDFWYEDLLEGWAGEQKMTEQSCVRSNAISNVTLVNKSDTCSESLVSLIIK